MEKQTKGVHTPGPWTCGPGAGGRYGIWATSLRYGVLDTSAPGIDVEANAALIAAAPDMLAALRDCVMALGRGGANVTGGPNRAEWEAARAVIQKAEGRDGGA